MINKKTPTGLSSFRIVEDSSHSQNEVNNLTENNHNDLNCLLPSYNIDTHYSHQVVSRPKKPKDFKNYIERDISSPSSKFQSI